MKLPSLAAKVALTAALTLGLAQTTFAQQDCMIGEVKWFAGNFAPRTWALAHGQLLPIAQNTALFSILGTTYGGDGRTSFGLPDLRGRSMIGAGSGPGLQTISWGRKSGAENVTLTQQQLPNHSHAVASQSGHLVTSKLASDTELPEGKVLADTQRAAIYAAMPDIEDDKTTTAAGSIQVDAHTTQTAGGSQSFSVRNPYTALNPIICLQGVFPSRS